MSANAQIGYIHKPLKTQLVNIRNIVLAFLLGTAALHAQNPELGFGHYRLVTTDDGLPSNNVTCFVQDKEGFMWLGTNEGLARFDGTTIRNYIHIPSDSTSLNSNKIKCLALDSAGYLWVGTVDEGLSRFDSEKQEFTTYQFHPADEKSISSNEIQVLTVDSKGRLWIGLDKKGICMYLPDGDAFSRMLPPDLNSSYRDRQTKTVNGILPDANDPDLLWITTSDGLWKYDLSINKWQLFDYQSEFKISGEIVGRSFRECTQGIDGKIYIASFRRGVFVFDPRNEKWQRYSERKFDPLRLQENNFQLIQQRDSNSFWLGSNTRGVSILDLSTGYVELLGNCDKNDPKDLCGLFVNAMKLDDNGTHWLATNRGFRIYHNRLNRLNSVNIDASAPHLKGRFNVRAIYPLNQNAIYYGGYAGEGVYKYDIQNRTSSIIVPPKGHRPNESKEMFWINQFHPYQGHKLLLVGAYQLYTLDTIADKIDPVRSNLNDGRSLQFYNHITHHSKGLYYLSTRHNGVYVLDSTLQVVDELIHNVNDSNSLVSSNYVFGTCEDPDGNLWIGTEEGFSVYNPETKSFDNLDYRTRMDSVPVLKGVYAIKLHPDSSLWFIDGVSSIAVLDYPYKKPYSFRIINSTSGLANDKVNNILIEENGKVWVSDKDAISLIEESGKIKNFSPHDEISLLRSLSPMAIMKNGDIILGAQKRLVWFNPEELINDIVQATLYISSFKIYGLEYDDKKRYTNVEEIELEYKENFFSIDIGVINYSHIGDLNLSYRLKGFSDEWTEMGKEQRAIFTNVPGGKYLFEAKITNANQTVLQNTLSLKIKIIPPFWKSWWFVPLLILLALTVFFSFYILRIGAIKREAKLKTAFNKRIANLELSALRSQMNPHFLFNSLNSIRHMIITNSNDKADEHLVKFSRLVRLVLQNSRSQLVPLVNDLDALKLYIELESGRFDGKFSSDLTISKEINPEKLFIPPMIIQPFVENAIWHGLIQKNAPGKVLIAVFKDGERLKIIIEDDGIGRAKARELKSKSAIKKESMGMEITGNRLEIIEKIYNIRCKVEIEDLVNNQGEPTGTRITISLPIEYGN